MEHVNCWRFRGIYKGGLWEDDLHVSAHIEITISMISVHIMFVHLKSHELAQIFQSTVVLC